MLKITIPNAFGKPSPCLRAFDLLVCSTTSTVSLISSVSGDMCLSRLLPTVFGTVRPNELTRTSTKIQCKTKTNYSF